VWLEDIETLTFVTGNLMYASKRTGVLESVKMCDDLQFYELGVCR